MREDIDQYRMSAADDVLDDVELVTLLDQLPAG